VILHFHMVRSFLLLVCIFSIHFCSGQKSSVQKKYIVNDLRFDPLKDRTVSYQLYDSIYRQAPFLLVTETDENGTPDGYWSLSRVSKLSNSSKGMLRKWYFRKGVLTRYCEYDDYGNLDDSVEYSSKHGFHSYSYVNGELAEKLVEKTADGKYWCHTIYFYDDENGTGNRVQQITWKDTINKTYSEQNFDASGYVTSFGIYEMETDEFIEIKSFFFGKLSEYRRRLPGKNGWEHQYFWPDNKLKAYRLLDAESNTIAFKGYYSNGLLHWKISYSETKNNIYIYDTTGVLEFQVPYRGSSFREAYYYKRNKEGKMMYVKGDFREKELGWGFDEGSQQFYHFLVFAIVYEPLMKAPYLFW
jgi:hypothetical protein